MGDPAWQLLDGLPAWEITEFPRTSHAPGDGSANSGGLAGTQRYRRMQSLAAAARLGSPAAFGWVRARAGGPVRVIAAGDGLGADDNDGAAGATDSTDQVIPLACPAGARGRALPPGGGARAFTALPCWAGWCWPSRSGRTSGRP